MTEMQRREFLRKMFIAGAGMATLSSSAILASCASSEKEAESDEDGFVAIRVSSDLYKSVLMQRFAFTIFNTDKTVASSGPVDVEVKSPSGRNTSFTNVKVRESGIKDRGIYSFENDFFEAGNWNITVNFKGSNLDLNVTVNETNVAPGISELVPTIDTPTDINPLDAKILCTSQDGNCGLHKKSVPELLNSKKPFVVLFATPARCQTAYCGPVLDLTKEVASKSNLETVHVEIYKDDISNDVLDAVSTWDLPSEPWLFLVSADGKVLKRLDGAFDKSEVQETYNSI